MHKTGGEDILAAPTGEIEGEKGKTHGQVVEGGVPDNDLSLDRRFDLWLNLLECGSCESACAPDNLTRGREYGIGPRS